MPRIHVMSAPQAQPRGLQNLSVVEARVIPMHVGVQCLGTSGSFGCRPTP